MMRTLTLASWQYDFALDDLEAQGLPRTKAALEMWCERFFGVPIAIQICDPVA